MSKFHKILSNGLVGLNVLLVFFLLFESKLQVPVFLQPLGRMHPLLLHLPIGLFVALIVLFLFKKELEADTFSKIFTLLAGTTALLAVSTAIFGLFLSNESSYSIDQLFWHKWTGVLFSWIAYLIYLFPKIQNPKIEWGILGAGMVAMIAAGHIGGEITHGENFIFEAFKTEEKIELTDSSNIYTAKIFPILEQKCIQCHNDQKVKGELNMSTIAKLMKGGKNGFLWEPGNALNSHLIKRALLPLEEKEHMPPKGKPQLTTYEIQVLTAWINEGASTDKLIGDYKTKPEFYDLVMGGAEKEFTPSKVYTFAGASESAIEEANTPFCSVYPLAYGSPALEAKFFVSQRFNVETLEGLKKVGDQIISLNLAKMPLTDKDLGIISNFKNLEYLNLNGTDIEGASIEELSKLKNLKSLAISNTKFTSQNMEKLKSLKSLEELYVWEVPMSNKLKDELQTASPKLAIFEGFDPSKEAPLRLNAPTLVNKKTVIKDKEKIVLKHVLKGVEIRYTLDGTTPDSANGLIYKDPIEMTKYTKLKACAVKDGWYSSEILESDFYFAKLSPISSTLLTAPNDQYKANGGQTLIDLKKGDIDNFKDNNWLGYKETDLVCLFEFEKAEVINNISVSYLSQESGYIMPPTKVEFWAGTDKNNLKLIQTQIPEQLTKVEPRKNVGISAILPAGSTYKYVKIVAKPIAKLPSWHRGKGDKGWVFIDEVFFN
ncbi:Uncharacterized membrane protein [Spirosomataceae bacterium TFI 002]|nr:Uncharacterized membrane protein [Spirosomataceae bacterium TFI 002]